MACLSAMPGTVGVKQCALAKFLGVKSLQKFVAAHASVHNHFTKQARLCICINFKINHFCIKPATRRLNGKVERSHLTDKLEFYQLIDYKGEVDLAKKLHDWEAFYNFLRPHAALNGKTPYERLHEKLVA